MIFVTLGSQKFQFNRLLKELDELIENKKINNEIFAQIGYSDYTPKNYKYKKFVDRDEFKNIMSECDIVITHGGTGAIITAVKQKKKVIGIPRLAQYGEHVDDHQIQLVKEFEKAGIIKAVYNLNKLEEALKVVKKMKFSKYESNTNNIINDIEDYIESSDRNEGNLENNIL